MNNELINDVEKIKDFLKKSPEYLALKEAEQIMDSDDEVKVLSFQKDHAMMVYNDDLKIFDRNSVESLKSHKYFSETVYLLNHHPLVKDYVLKLLKYNDLLEKINEEIFDL